jgi:hypothetical protein
VVAGSLVRIRSPTQHTICRPLEKKLIDAMLQNNSLYRDQRFKRNLQAKRQLSFCALQFCPPFGCVLWRDDDGVRGVRAPTIDCAATSGVRRGGLRGINDHANSSIHAPSRCQSDNSVQEVGPQNLGLQNEVTAVHPTACNGRNIGTCAPVELTKAYTRISGQSRPKIPGRNSTAHYVKSE